MRKISILLAFVLVFINIGSRPVFAAQASPVPYINCGVGWEDDKNPPDTTQLKSGGQLERYACCYSKLNDTINNYNLNSLSSIPIIGSILQTMTTFVISIAVNLPNMVPGQDSQSVRGIAAPVCAQNANPIGEPSTDTCYCQSGGSAALTSLAQYCGNITNQQEQIDCMSCLGIARIDATQIVIGGKGFNYNQKITFKDGGVWTGIGCVKTSLKEFVQETVLGLGIGIAGAMALICIIFASIQMQLSRGTPEKIKKAQELLTSCIMGLIVIIFSVFLLRIIGVNILRIPGFN